MMTIQGYYDKVIFELRNDRGRRWNGVFYEDNNRTNQ